jgi:putative transposase
VDRVALAPTVRKTFKYKLAPTPEQERDLERVVRLCRSLYNTALEQRITAWTRCQVSVSRFQQEAELKEIRAAFPEYAAIHSHVLQDVLTRLEKAYQAFFRRVQRGDQAGFPRFHGCDRFHSFTFKEYGNGARLDNGVLVLSKIGRIALRWSRPLEGTPKTVTISREADGWYVCVSCADVPVQPLPRTGQQTGIDLGLDAFATLADGRQIANPRLFRVAEMALKRAQRRVPRRVKGSHRRRKAVKLLAKAHQQVQRQRQDCHHKMALSLVASTIRSLMKTCRWPTWSRITTSPRASAMLGGVGFWPSSLSQQQTLGSKPSSCHSRSPHKPVQAAASWSTKACRSAGMPARTVAPACSGTRMPP